ncbi:MAG: peptidylprolyl isomerase [Candidatus Methylumidiphilus sp.]
MKKTCLIGAVVLTSALLVGCGITGGKSAASADKDAGTANVENAVAVVNGKPISKNALNNLMSEIGKQNPDQNVSEDKAVESLVSRELLRQDAERQNLQKNPAVIGRLENVTRDVLAQAAIDSFRKGIVVTDAECRKEYDAKIAGAELTEFKARHILVETDTEAKEVLASLKKGAKFADLAKKYSKDPSAQQNGGDLGWFNPGQMLPEFSNAVASLKNGETSPTPVKTKFGWHVIQREDVRKQAPPAFDDIKEQIRTMLIGQKLQQHIEELKKSAKIETFVSGKK